MQQLFSVFFFLSSRPVVKLFAFLAFGLFLSSCESLGMSEDTEETEGTEVAQTSEAVEEEAEEEEEADYDTLYGALAFSDVNRIWTAVYNIETPEEARGQALSDCGPTCQIELVFGPGQCGTFAFGRTSWAVGVGLGRKPDEAVRTAIIDCRQQGGAGCQAVQPFCNSVLEEEEEES